MSYKCLGGNYYEITLALPRNCSGTQMLDHDLKFTNDCGVNFNVMGLEHEEIVESGHLCSAESDNTTCNGGTSIGLRTYIFRHTIYLSPCSGWKISWSVCCRPGSLNLIGLPGIYVEALLDNQDGACNDSPVFLEPDLPFVCLGQTMNYDPFVVEPDGDSLAFALIDARYAAPNPLPVFYQDGWSGSQPFTDLSIDATTGRITFTPTQAGQVVVVVRANEYRNGELVGSAMRDHPIMVTACENQVPAIGAGQLTTSSEGVTITGPYAFELCTQIPGSVQAEFTDPDPGQVLVLWSTVEAALPGAEITVSGTDPLLMVISWEAIEAPGGTRHFGVKVQDDHCPLRGLQTYSYSVLVREFFAPIAPGEAVTCSNAGSFTLADSLDTTLPPDGSWSAPDGAPHSGEFDPATDPAGIYTYTLHSGTNCQFTATVAVTVLPANALACNGLGMHDDEGLPWRIWPTPSTGMLYMESASDLGPCTVTDMNGRMVWQGRPIAQGGMHIIQLPQHLSNGTYMLRSMNERNKALPMRVVLIR